MTAYDRPPPQMSYESKIARYYQYIRIGAASIPVIAPILFIITMIAYHVDLFNVNSETNWIFWFIGDEYVYISQNYSGNPDALFLLHDFDLVQTIVLSLVVSYTALTMLVIVATRHYERDVIYGTSIMTNIRRRARMNRMRPVYRFLLLYALVIAVAIWLTVSYCPDVGSVVLRSWADTSLVTFVIVQLIVGSLVLMLASEWLIMVTIVLVSLAPLWRKDVTAD
jgi:hypothetical protein